MFFDFGRQKNFENNVAFYVVWDVKSIAPGSETRPSFLSRKRSVFDRFDRQVGTENSYPYLPVVRFKIVEHFRLENRAQRVIFKGTTFLPIYGDLLKPITLTK